MSNELKQSLREATVGAESEFRREIVEYDGQEFEIKEPSVALRGKIISKSGLKIKGADVDEDSMDLSFSQVYSVIYCTYVPGTDERVFEESDAPILANKPAGSFVDKFSSVAMRLMQSDAEEEAKN